LQSWKGINLKTAKSSISQENLKLMKISTGNATITQMSVKMALFLAAQPSS
jgi:hypothetical protein